MEQCQEDQDEEVRWSGYITDQWQTGKQAADDSHEENRPLFFISNDDIPCEANNGYIIIQLI